MKRLAAIGMTVAAIALASAAQAQPSPPAPGASTEAGAPLTLRADKPLELAKEPQHAGVGWKLAAVLAALGGAALYMRKRGGTKVKSEAGIAILRRTTVGFRSELLVVNVEGQRLLLGVTPHTIQSIAILDGDEAADVHDSSPAMASRGSARGASLGDRFAGMLDAAERAAEAPGAQRRQPSVLGARAAGPSSLEGRPARGRQAPATPVDSDDEPDQAAGLRAALRRGP